MSNYGSGRKHAKHRYRYILAVNLPDTFRCPKRQIATKKRKIICFSSMYYHKQKNSHTKYNLRTAFLRFAPDKWFDSSRFLTFRVYMAWHTLQAILLYLTSLPVSLTGKNNRFPILDILGYLKNTHKNPKFGKVRRVPTREFPTKFPGWDLSHSSKFGIFVGIL